MFKKTNKLKKIMGGVAIILILIAILALTVPIPFSQEYSALEIKLDDPLYIVERTITISGHYHINIFTNNEFAGKISVSDYKWTQDSKVSVKFMKEGCPLEYKYDKDVNGRTVETEYVLGKIYAGFWFREMCVTVFDQNTYDHNDENASGGGWDTIGGVCIVPSTNTREQAIEVLRSNRLIP